MQNFNEQFTKIYKQHTQPIIKKYLDKKVWYQPIAYTVDAGRNRYRAGLAYILSDKQKQGKAIGAAAEIAWAACLVFDDIGDRDVIRRKKLTAWKKFGLLWSVHSAALGLSLIKDLLKDYKLNNETIKFFDESFLITLKSQIEQACFSLSISPEKVLLNYFHKGMLGKWPIEAATQINKKIRAQDKRTISSFAINLSIAAQIKNDLQDIIIDPKTKLCMRDIREGILTYPIAIFFKKANFKHKRIFQEKMWSQKQLRPEETQHIVINLFQKYRILDYCNKQLQERVNNALLSLKTIEHSEIKKILLTWGETYKKTSKDI